MGEFLVIGVLALVAGIVTVLARERLARSQARRRRGRAGRMSVEAGTATPGFIGLTGFGMIVIGTAQILIGIFARP
jgi:hypothetical protein